MIIQKTALWREKQKCATLCWGEVKKSVNQLYSGIEENVDFSQVNTEQLCKGTCNQWILCRKMANNAVFLEDSIHTEECGEYK